MDCRPSSLQPCLPHFAARFRGGRLPRTGLLLSLVFVILVSCGTKPGGGAAGPADGRAGHGPSAGGRGGKKGPQAFPVEVQTIAVRQLEYTLAAVGSVLALEEAQVAARVAGTVEELRFQEGDRIEAGQVLAAIETKRYRIAVDQARAAVERARAQLEDARRTLQRRKAMGPNVASGEEIDASAAQVQIRQAELGQAKAALDMAELNLHDAHVRSPVGGIVQTRKLQTGSYAQPGAVLATILRSDSLRLRFAVPEPDAARIQPGQPLRASVRGVIQPLTATVRHIGGKADEVSRLVEVLADIAPPLDGLRPGAFAEVVVPIGAPYPAVVVPQSAVRPSEKGFLAFVLDGDKARERVLQLGMRTQDGLVEVKSGLQGGEQLVVLGAEALREGAVVRVGAGGGAPSAGAPAAIRPAGTASEGQGAREGRAGRPSPGAAGDKTRDRDLPAAATATGAP